MSEKEPKAKATGKGAVQTPNRKPKAERVDSKSKANITQETVTIPDVPTSDVAVQAVSTSVQHIKKKATGSVKEATDVRKKTTDVVQKTTDVVQKTTDAVKETTDVAQKTRDVMKKPTDIRKKATIVIPSAKAQAPSQLSEPLAPTAVVVPEVKEVVPESVLPTESSKPAAARKKPDSATAKPEVIPTPTVVTGKTSGKSKTLAAKKTVHGIEEPASQIIERIESKPATIQPKTATIQPKTATIQPKTATIQPKTATIQPKTAAIEPKLAAIEPKPATIEPKPATIEPKPATIEPKPATIEPKTATIHPPTQKANTQTSPVAKKTIVAKNLPKKAVNSPNINKDATPPQLIVDRQVSTLSEPPVPPVDDVWSARLQAIDARYGNDRSPAPTAKTIPPSQDIPPQEKAHAKHGVSGAKPPQPLKKNIHPDHTEHSAIQQVPVNTPPVEPINEASDDDAPKLSYWQQRRLNKKLKQQALQSGGDSVESVAPTLASTAQSTPQPSTFIPVKRDVSPKQVAPNPILVEAILKALEQNETVIDLPQVEEPHPIIKEAILQAIEENKDTATAPVDDEIDSIATKPSYWQQRRLNKKLKQQANPTELINPTVQTAPPAQAIEPVAVPVALAQPQTIPQNIPEPVVASNYKESIPEIIEDSSAEPDDSDEEAPKLSYWQQRRLNKKLKQQALRPDDGKVIQNEQPAVVVPPANAPKAQPTSLQPFVTRKDTPVAPVAVVEAMPEVPVVIPRKLTKVQQRQLDKKLKLQAEEDARQAEAEAATAASIALVAQDNLTAEEETLPSPSSSSDSLDEPISPKLSYWQQRRLNKKLKQLGTKPEGTELLSTEQVVAPQTVKAEIVSESVIDDESPTPLDSQEPPKKLTYWQQKRLNKKLAKQKELEQAELLPPEETPDKTLETAVEKRILPVPEGKRILPVPEGKKILPIPESKKVPVPEGKKVLPVPEGKKILPVPEGKKILPVPEGKKILPVPEGKKILPVPEKKAQPHVKKEFDSVIEHVPIPPLVAPKTQYPPKPKPILPPLPEELREIVARVEHFMTHELNVYHEATILLGVSGGVDSMVMLDIFAYLSHKYDFSIHVGHCNHHLRGEDSHEDERMVKRVAHKYGLYFHHTSLKVQEFANKHKNSVEQAARTLRYHFFEKMAKTTVAGFVATAHTADDSAETFLLNLLRGSGLTGLAGIPARRELSKRVHVIRPLLPLLKSEVIQYATARGLEWREDVSNKSLLYTRNKIRLQLLPTLREQFSPAIVETINRTARLLLGADEIVNERAEALISMMLRSVGKSAVAISIPHLESVNDFLKGEIIQKILKEKFQTLPVSMHTIDRIIGLATGAENGMCSVTPAIDALRDRQEILLRKNNALEIIDYQIPKIGKLNTDTFSISMKELTKKDVKFSDNPNIEFLDADLVPLWLTIRSWQDGDRIQPLGMAGSMTVSDFLTNEKVELIDKEKTLVLCAGTEVIWICGRRVSDKFKVGPTTKRIICAEFISKTESAIKQDTVK